MSQSRGDEGHLSKIRAIFWLNGYKLQKSFQIRSSVSQIVILETKSLFCHHWFHDQADLKCNTKKLECFCRYYTLCTKCLCIPCLENVSKYWIYKSLILQYAKFVKKNAEQLPKKPGQLFHILRELLLLKIMTLYGGRTRRSWSTSPIFKLNPK